MKILIVDDERSVEQSMSIASERCSSFGQLILNKETSAVVQMVRCFEEAKWILESNEEFDYLLLDHDLGSLTDIYDDGTRLMNILEEKIYHSGIINPKVVIPISSNPSGVTKINSIYKKILERHSK